MMAPIDYGIRAAEFTGIGGESAISQLNVFKTRIQSLIDDTSMTPEELEKKRAELATEITKSSASIEAGIQQEDLARTITIRNKIQEEYTAVKEDTSLTKGLRDDYKTLLDTANLSVKIQENRLKGMYTPVNTNPSGPSNPMPPFVGVEDLEIEFQNLEDRQQDEINKGDVKFERIWRKFYYYTKIFFSWAFFLGLIS